MKTMCITLLRSCYLLSDYKVKVEKRVIPTGIELAKFERPEIKEQNLQELRSKLGIQEDEKMLLSLSRISFEKNIQAVLNAFAEVLKEEDKVKLVAGDGPYLDSLKEQAGKLNIQKHVIFTGMIAPSETALYYKAADFFISASTSETQGLTYLESLASGTPVIAHGNPYLDNLISDKMFGTLYYGERELAGAILEALIATPDMSEQKLADKLYEISAENFGKRVHEFYLDAMISNKFEQELRGDEPMTQRFLKTILYLPQQAVSAPVKESKRILKASKEQLSSIRDYWRD